jgi:hypothetical protein
MAISTPVSATDICVYSTVPDASLLERRGAGREQQLHHAILAIA